MSRPSTPQVDLLDSNIQNIMELQERSRQRQTETLHRPIDRLIALLSRPATLYVFAVVIVLWVMLNIGKNRPDPAPFPEMAFILTALSQLTTISVLIVQARDERLARGRAELELQINLLAEQKIAKLIALVEELRRDLPNVPNRDDPEARAMQQGADPASVLEALERREQQGQSQDE